VAAEPERLRFSVSQAALLREVLADASPDVVGAGERRVGGEVVERHETDAVVDVLATAFLAEGRDDERQTARGKETDDLIGISFGVRSASVSGLALRQTCPRGDLRDCKT
jgi:hypothetical protein